MQTPVVEPTLTEPAPTIASPPPGSSATPKVEGPEFIQWLVIPDLDVDSRVFYVPFGGETWDITGLKDNIAWLQNSEAPGIPGNVVLAGHVMVRYIGNGPFRSLYKLAPGNQAMVYTNRNVYTYVVREQLVVDITEGSIAEDTGQPRLTLVTCTSWDEKAGIYRKRLVVVAELLKVEPLSDQMIN